MKDQFYAYIETLQDKITSELEKIDGKSVFKEDLWKRPEGGGGRTRIIENGNVFEKGGVNISAVHGELPEVLQKQLKVRFFITSIADNKLGQKVVLIIEGEVKGLELDWHQIDPIKRPKNIYFVPVFSETSSGKIQRQKTLEMLNLNQP